MSFNDIISPIEDIIDDAARGRMFILMDDEDRENEGDLVIPAEKADAAAINFMARFGRGLICLSLTSERSRKLSLPLMALHNASRHQTAFTVSIEAREGVTTGISAADRAQTIKVAIAPNSTPKDIVTPGHIFPLVAKDGGVLVRAGHTEASVDISRLAGLDSSGVICEILNEDGTMARRDDLIPYARNHGLKIGLISDLIAYRRRTEKLVARLFDDVIDSPAGGRFSASIYGNQIDDHHYLVLSKGAIAGDEPVLVRMHAANLFDDVLRVGQNGCADTLHSAMLEIENAGRGVIVLFNEPLTRPLAEQILKKDGAKDRGRELRDYGIGAQILLDQGVRRMVLLTNSPRTIIGLDGYGLEVVGHRSIPMRPVCDLATTNFAAPNPLGRFGGLLRGTGVS